MVEDPENIRQNIQYYQYLLTLYCTRSAQQQVLSLLARAEAQLHLAETGAPAARARDA